MNFDFSNLLTSLQEIQLHCIRTNINNYNAQQAAMRNSNVKQGDKPKRTRRRQRSKKELSANARLDVEQSEENSYASLSLPSTSRQNDNECKTPNMNNKKSSSPHFTSVTGTKPKVNVVKKQRFQKWLENRMEQKTENQNSPSISSQSDANLCKNNVLNWEFIFITGSHSSPGSYIRSRNKKNKYITLRSFLINGMERPCVFKTNFSVFKLVEDLKILDLNTKITSRKYPTPKKPKRNKRQKSMSTDNLKKFPEYLTEKEVQILLESGYLIKGTIRINPKSCTNSYVNNEDTSLADYYLTSVRDRNRALEGDDVVLKIKPEEDWLNGYKTATVVYLREKV